MLNDLSNLITPIFGNGTTYVNLDKATPARVRDALRYNTKCHKMHMEDLVCGCACVVLIGGTIYALIDKWDKHLILKAKIEREKYLEREVEVNAKIID